MKKGCYVPVGRCPTAGLRCRVGRFWTSATGSQHPRRRRDAGTAAAVTERATCQRPAQSRVPPPSLMAQLPSGERPAPTEPAGENKGRHTLGAVGQESSEETSVASKMPSRVSAAASVGAERCPPGTSAPASFLSRKLGKELYPPTARTCASGSHRRGVQPPSLGANCQGCNPRESRAQALGKLYVGSPFSCSVNLRGQPTGCPRFFYAAPSSRAPG